MIMVKNLLLLIGCFVAGLVIALIAFRPSTDSEPVVQSSAAPSATPFSFSVDEPPAQTLQGQILNSSGDIKWQSRSATEAAKLTQKVPIRQGEQLETGEDGRLTLQFPGISQIRLNPESKLYLAQTLPANLLFDQKTGSATYQKLGQPPVSIRAGFLLIKQNDGQLSVEVDVDYITVSVTQGSATIAYNDADFVSQVVDIKVGDRLVADRQAREVEIN